MVGRDSHFFGQRLDFNFSVQVGAQPNPRALEVVDGPAAEVNANASDPQTKIRSLPIGINGMNVPVMTGTQEVAGTAANTDSPAAELMRNIAGKNMGSNSSGWLTWYGEKVGQVTSADWLDAKLHHGGKPRVNGNTSTPSGPYPQQP
jgi:hypothetical protein